MCTRTRQPWWVWMCQGHMKKHSELVKTPKQDHALPDSTRFCQIKNAPNPNAICGLHACPGAKEQILSRDASSEHVGLYTSATPKPCQEQQIRGLAARSGVLSQVHNLHAGYNQTLWAIIKRCGLTT